MEMGKMVGKFDSTLSQRCDVPANLLQRRIVKANIVPPYQNINGTENWAFLFGTTNEQ